MRGHEIDVSGGAFGDRLELDRSSIIFSGVLGRGNFGVVHKAMLKSEEGSRPVAVKIAAENSSEEIRSKFLSEISLVTSFQRHENIIGIIGCCTVGDEPVYLVSEFMQYGDLLHFLWDAREDEKRANDPIFSLTQASIHDIGAQVANGMEYLARLKIIHGDLAARNVLVGEGLRCKISDFGLSNDVYRYGAIRGAREKQVPIKWVSPERMMAGRVPITWRSDVWSFGILLYECVTLGATPYPDVNGDELFERLKHGYRMSRPTACSEFLYRLQLKCWDWTPSKRPIFKELKEKLQFALPDEDKSPNHMDRHIPKQPYASLINTCCELQNSSYNCTINT